MSTQPIVDQQPLRPSGKTADELADQLVSDMMAALEPRFSKMTPEERSQLLSELQAVNDATAERAARH